MSAADATLLDVLIEAAERPPGTLRRRDDVIRERREQFRVVAGRDHERTQAEVLAAILPTADEGE